VRARIAQLESRIRVLSLYDLSSVPRGVVGYGSLIKVLDLDEGTTLVFEIVMPEEVNASQGKISVHSPIGRALMGKEVGEEVDVQTPRGQRSYRIVELTTIHDRTDLGTS
jgi:transcription elongation factor GreA